MFPALPHEVAFVLQLVLAIGATVKTLSSAKAIPAWYRRRKQRLVWKGVLVAVRAVESDLCPAAMLQRALRGEDPMLREAERLGFIKSKQSRFGEFFYDRTARAIPRGKPEREAIEECDPDLATIEMSYFDRDRGRMLWGIPSPEVDLDGCP